MILINESILDSDRIKCETIDNDESQCEKTFKCEFCDKEFLQHCELKIHLYIHNDYIGIKDVKYDICNNIFKGKNSLKIHKETAHSKVSTRKVKKKKKFKCCICPQSFSEELLLKRHFEIMHLDQNMDENEKHNKNGFECETCGKTFAQKRNLKRHINIVHERSKIYSCDVCGKDFGYLQTLQRHDILRHGGLSFKNMKCKYKYKCDSCPLAFSEEALLKSHIDIAHEPINKKNSEMQKNLNCKMEKSQNTSKSINCEICGETFSNNEILNSHINQIHQDFLEKYC